MKRRAKREPFTAARAADWQKHSDSLKTAQVQFLTSGGTMMGLCPLWYAQDLVRDGGYFVISAQAIGQFEAE